jgi:hypothetical protein
MTTTKTKSRNSASIMGVGDGGESCGDPVPCGDNDDGEEKVLSLGNDELVALKISFPLYVGGKGNFPIPETLSRLEWEATSHGMTSLSR